MKGITACCCNSLLSQIMLSKYHVCIGLTQENDAFNRDMKTMLLAASVTQNTHRRCHSQKPQSNDVTSKQITWRGGRLVLCRHFVGFTLLFAPLAQGHSLSGQSALLLLVSQGSGAVTDIVCTSTSKLGSKASTLFRSVQEPNC